MKATALTIDTHTVMSNSYDFDNGLLGQLKRFRGSAVQLVISDVVVREIQKHLRHTTRKARDSIDVAHRDGLRFGLLPPAQKPMQGVDADQVADARLAQFFEETGAIVVPTDQVALEDVLRKYFDASPPFSTEKGKQKEFPDAIALMALELWAVTNQRRIVAVSGDSDWRRYSASSLWIDHTDNLGEALQSFQEELAAAVLKVQRIFREMRQPENALITQLEGCVSLALMFAAFEARAESVCVYRTESINVDYTGFNIAENAVFNVVGISPTEISIEILAAISGHATADIQLFLYDAAKSEFVDNGTVLVERDVEFASNLLITFSDPDSTDVQVTDVTIIGSPEVDLGDIDQRDANDA